MVSSANERCLATMASGAFISASLAAFVGFRFFDPNQAGNPFLPCMFYTLTGYWCPGCGGTRAAHALAHGDFAHALNMNPLLPMLILLYIGTVLWLYGWRPQWMQKAAIITSSVWFWILLLPGYWIARNLPWPPFSWLAPG